MVPGVTEKSIGAEETFDTDIGDPEVIRRELLRLSGRTAQGLRSAGAVARTVVIKLRLADFTTITRSRTLPAPTDVAQLIYTTACALHEAAGLPGGARLRLVGVRASGCSRPLPPRRSWLSATGPPPGGRPSRPSTRSPGGSARTRCGPRPWSAAASRPR